MIRHMKKMVLCVLCPTYFVGKLCGDNHDLKDV